LKREPQRGADPAKDSHNRRYINREQLHELIPVTAMTIWRWTADPEIRFPQSVKLGADGRNFWWLPAVQDFLHRRSKRTPRRRTPPRRGK